MFVKFSFNEVGHKMLGCQRVGCVMSGTRHRVVLRRVRVHPAQDTAFI